ncbi:MAG: hypothetical protein A3H06_01470 [Candidatus Colwellbacteria bacterium RIFCSPLOWO2_12_FULL_44_13]|uniref:DUF378 domain-containing protein n=3 Tax=Candidatus Colwelliibacteriota TaxID=1817904 RepID=A0A1G1Z735_9BACT|nr:MAG: hypothetical protein A3F24_02210 [Candidatus Colwellbacteria bacterium RIFCSPHIGHO2_12_FULL_44_17]OGY60428.1 MAG: hypothetical protein A3I31_01015 [Candidatus Colwellbacteria bacterium RIFCSPLOWO2_02_FULL_44_20b]OGY61344.1 MAG: hypothetical protein A3H06_01470 [Candidatus Colwellbacteria bacterium RIFCSPLOWO2_12_FULL_44_13]
MKVLHSVAFILLVVGGLNWLLEVFGVGIGSFLPSVVADIVYVLVGLSAIYEVVTHKGRCKNCESMGSPAAPMQQQ